MTNRLEEILELYKKYIKCDSYFYKICHDLSSISDKRDDRWLVIMKKTNNTKTNEARSNIPNEECTKYAKFRANELEVVEIFDAKNPYTTQSYIIHSYGLNKIKYKVGEIVKADKYNDDIDAVCTNGIHYFKTIQCAYYYRNIPEDYTGVWFEWYDNGTIKSYYNYKNGEKSGSFIEFHENGVKSIIGCYKSGNKTNKWTYYNKYGDITQESVYKSGKLIEIKHYREIIRERNDIFEKLLMDLKI
jgi:antitoxin component YwqK of YwqJK toxin-antitoxin module